MPPGLTVAHGSSNLPVQSTWLGAVAVPTGAVFVEVSENLLIDRIEGGFSCLPGWQVDECLNLSPKVRLFVGRFEIALALLQPI